MLRWNEYALCGGWPHSSCVAHPKGPTHSTTACTLRQTAHPSPPHLNSTQFSSSSCTGHPSKHRLSMSVDAARDLLLQPQPAPPPPSPTAVLLVWRAPVAECTWARIPGAAPAVASLVAAATPALPCNMPAESPACQARTLTRVSPRWAPTEARLVAVGVGADEGATLSAPPAHDSWPRPPPSSSRPCCALHGPGPRACAAGDEVRACRSAAEGSLALVLPLQAPVPLPTNAKPRRHAPSARATSSGDGPCASGRQHKHRARGAR